MRWMHHAEQVIVMLVMDNGREAILIFVQSGPTDDKVRKHPQTPYPRSLPLKSTSSQLSTRSVLPFPPS